MKSASFTLPHIGEISALRLDAKVVEPELPCETVYRLFPSHSASMRWPWSITIVRWVGRADRVPREVRLAVRVVAIR